MDTNKEELINGEGTVTEPETQKESLLNKISGAYMKFRATKVGRGIVRGVKLLSIGGGLYGAFKIGENHVKPVTVYVEKLPEAEAAETTAEEPVEETEETQD